MAVAFTTTVRMQFSPGVWTDVSEDVVRPIRFMRGMKNNGPKDNIAEVGSLEFGLRNDEENSAETLGLYSTNNPNCRAGFGEATPVQVLFSSGSLVDQARWTGKVYTALPDTGVNGPRRVHVVAQDVMGDLADADVLEIERQFEKTEVEVLTAVLDSLPASAQPVARDFDPAVTQFPVALDDMAGGERAWGVCEKIVTSARGCLYPLGDGTLKYQSFDARVLEVRRFTFDDTILMQLDVPSSRTNVFNLVRTTTHPRVFLPNTSPAIMALASHVGVMAIAAGATEEVFLTYRDPDRPELNIGGTDFVDDGGSPAGQLSATDYEFNAAADGSGLDVTADIVVTADFFPSAVKLTVENTGAVTAYRQLLQVRGRGIYNLAPSTRRAYTPMAYTQKVDIDLPYQDDDAFAQQVADLLEASYRDLADQVDGLTFTPQDSDELMEQALTLEIGQVVDASETVVLPLGVSAYIQSIEMTVTADDQLICRFGLAPRIVGEASQDEEVWVHDHIFASAAAPETRIGFGLIGFMEIG